MFTGIIFEQGTIQKLQRSAAGLKLTIAVTSIPKNVRKGVSIGLDGVCLSLINKRTSSFSFFIMNETLRKTHFGDKKMGDTVNIEYPMEAGDFISGHFVSGHVDAVFTVKKCVHSKKDHSLTFSLPVAHSRAVICRGSIALNGVSLTVSQLSPRSFTVSLIPLTLQKTNLSLLREGDRVNVEFDMIGKFVAQILKNQAWNQ